ncbi:ExeM/NucH family extracellular endonuclease [Methylomonas sp. SURF-2]|uniref:ExeM/NucH family extracellular endonuclease n=1 Tax=Methylomonas subterranea TaxID=2952225 RepID=A0ABT1TDH0_9GAMM|nr:ExeM/NucH family extracellular endonuclease [Methylomonas sp. SURF-2]MCQ8103495.1 ExeM/NucH family extracellular endonuclease [Methylomonas sp. SURF-2]
MFTSQPMASVLALSATLGLSAQAQAATPVFINEIHYDNAGTDVGEAIEIAGPAGTDLNGWSLLLYNGNGGAVYDSKLLSGTLGDQTGNGFGTLSIAYPSNGIQNGAPDGIALVNAGGAVVQFLSYEGTFSASNGPASGMTSVDIGVQQSGGTPAGQSLQLKGSGRHYEDFAWQTESAASFGAPNQGQTFGDDSGNPPPVSQCGQPATPIGAIQGSGPVSPLNGSVQHVEATVTGDFGGSANLGGFFLQQPQADNDPASSEGLFVQSNTPVRVGDRVHVVGKVDESFGMTRLVGVSSVEVCAAGLPLPAALDIHLPFDPQTNDPERWEGMRVRLPQTLLVNENFNLARFGEFIVSSERQFAPTQVAAPGQAAIDRAALDSLDRLVIDDGSNTQNPDPLIYPQPAGLSAANSLRGGDSVTGAVGILAYDFGAYRLQPTQALQFGNSHPRPSAPLADANASLKVASFNVLNYFNGNGAGGGFPTSRGANSPLEFARQRAKIVNALAGLNADIVGLMEIENDGYGADSAIADLVNGLNQQTGAGRYAFVNVGVNKIGSDEIAVGLIYQAAKVVPLGSARLLDQSVDSRFNDGKNRPTLAQSFLDKASNKTLTVAVNHLKSKGSACDDVNDPDTGDGQGNCNLTRTAAAQALASWLDSDPTGQSSPHTLIIGDLNSYAQEDPISVLKNAGYDNLPESRLGNQVAYSYVFQGGAGYLDHALANAALAPQVKAVTDWHINADEPRALDYNVEFKSAGQIDSFYAPDAYRSSDHDPLLLQLFVPGDLDGDGDVDSSDAGVFRAQLGKCANKPGFKREADYNASGCADYADYRIWYAHYLAYLQRKPAQ